MPSDQPGPDDPTSPYSSALAAAAVGAVPGWVVRCVVQRCHEAGAVVDETVFGAAAVAGVAAARLVERDLRSLFATDIDEQRTGPLEVLRSAVVFPTRVLGELGVPPVDRDDFERRAFPGDVYGLSPASFSDVDEVLHEPGLAWGAAKAHTHLQRRRSLE